MAKILYGDTVREAVRARVEENLSKLRTAPKLVIIHVGSDPASEVYIGSKVREAIKAGITCEVKSYRSDVETETIVKEVRRLNSDNSVNGIMVQLPLPDTISVFRVMKEISPKKDVDGLNPFSVGRLMGYGEEWNLAPCTPSGIMEMLSDVDLEGKHVVIVGRSNIVGKPLAMMLLEKNATVTICHSHTKNLADYTIQADILVVAVGKPKFVTADMVKKNAIVIDVGINRTEDGLVGDVDFKEIEPLVSAITPVPKGVGVTTVAKLMENVVKSAMREEGVDY